MLNEDHLSSTTSLETTYSVEGEHLRSTTEDSMFQGESNRSSAEQIPLIPPIVHFGEGEPVSRFPTSKSIAHVQGEPDHSDAQNDDTHPTLDYPSDTKEITSETLPEYDPAYPPFDKWTRYHLKKQVLVEPKNVKDAFQHSDWVEAMQSELADFERNKVWRLIPKAANTSIVDLEEACYAEAQEPIPASFIFMG
ncbi:hypothetical protein L2E82_35607 [Cichorium intybus]|uniref:Uncharacterized protein n=1 Tax=Cichorium intybus TaxID=13427 RepID=A0ACB9BP87_CICIN|nr:hypothetical protein L2E82_35607 [Cichorium intybus]